MRSSRLGSGFGGGDVEIDDTARGFVASGSLGPAKARVLLMTARLSGTEDLQARYFGQR